MHKKKSRIKRMILSGIVAGLAVQMPVYAYGWWEYVDGEGYWYEDGVKQGTEGRGKEIYDPTGHAWYWLDAEQGGKIAKNKDVYQESQADREGNIGKWVRYDSDGKMVKGWDVTDRGTYYFDLTYGTMAKGNRYIDGANYIFNEQTGIMESCSVGLDAHWVTIDGKEYWYEGGIRQGYYPKTWNYRGEEIYDPGSDAWYWLDAVQQGARAVSKDVFMDSQANELGAMGKWVHYDAEGHMVKGWDTNENGTYYFDPVYGTMAKGMVVVDGKAYRFNEDTGICEGEDKSVLNPVKNKYDVAGRPLEEYDAEGNLLVKYTYEPIYKGSWLRETREDGTGRVFKVIYYNEYDELDSWTDWQYDEDGKTARGIDYDRDGKVTGWTERRYDENGNLIEEAVYNGDGKPKLYTETRYDKNGNEIASTKKLYENGNILKETYRTDNYSSNKDFWYDEDGVVQGWFESQYDSDHAVKYITYDKDGTVKKWTEYKYDENGEQIGWRDYQYNENGERIGWRDYDGNGDLVQEYLENGNGDGKAR